MKDKKRKTPEEGQAAGKSPKSRQIKYASKEEFEAILEKGIREHRELWRRLAKR